MVLSTELLLARTRNKQRNTDLNNHTNKPRKHSKETRPAPPQKNKKQKTAPSVQKLEVPPDQAPSAATLSSPVPQASEHPGPRRLRGSPLGSPCQGKRRRDCKQGRKTTCECSVGNGNEPRDSLKGITSWMVYNGSFPHSLLSTSKNTKKQEAILSEALHVQGSQASKTPKSLWSRARCFAGNNVTPRA